MYTLLIVIHVLVAFGLILIVLLQSGRGAELGAAFGGIGQATYGQSRGTMITKVTTALAVVFMATSLTLAFIATERPSGSVLESGPGAASEAPGAVVPSENEGQATAPAQDQQATGSVQPVEPAGQEGSDGMEQTDAPRNQ